MILLKIYSIAGLLYWLLMARAAVRLPSVPTLRASASVRERRPSLTVIVPACNEAAELEPAARTLLAQNYPELELIFVNDRSTDATGRIIDEMARGNSRVVTVHIEALPERWLGKVHALHIGLQGASGQIVLFTDADVHFAKDTLAQAVQYFLDNELDHLAGFPPGRWPDWRPCPMEEVEMKRGKWPLSVKTEQQREIISPARLRLHCLRTPIPSRYGFAFPLKPPVKSDLTGYGWKTWGNETFNRPTKIFTILKRQHNAMSSGQ